MLNIYFKFNDVNVQSSEWHYFEGKYQCSYLLFITKYVLLLKISLELLVKVAITL